MLKHSNFNKKEGLLFSKSPNIRPSYGHNLSASYEASEFCWQFASATPQHLSLFINYICPLSSGQTNAIVENFFLAEDLQIAGNADCQIANCQSREETDRGDHTQQYDNAYCIIYQIAIVQHILYTCANPNRGPHTLTQHAVGEQSVAV